MSSDDEQLRSTSHSAPIAARASQALNPTQFIRSDTQAVAPRRLLRRDGVSLLQVLHRGVAKRAGTAEVTHADDELRLDPLRASLPQRGDRRSLGAQAGNTIA